MRLRSFKLMSVHSFIHSKRTTIALHYSSSLAVLSRSASCATLVYCLTVNLPWSITFQKLQVLASINYVGCDSLDVLLARRLQHSWFPRSFCPTLITAMHCWRDYRAVRSSICSESRMRLLVSSATCVHTTTWLQPWSNSIGCRSSQG